MTVGRQTNHHRSPGCRAEDRNSTLQRYGRPSLSLSLSLSLSVWVEWRHERDRHPASVILAEAEHVATLLGLGGRRSVEVADTTAVAGHAHGRLEPTRGDGRVHELVLLQHVGGGLSVWWGVGGGGCVGGGWLLAGWLLVVGWLVPPLASASTPIAGRCCPRACAAPG
eukprot:COSAG03_NODE_2603_length_2602_cov_164.274071_3_plen_168_part_00